MSNNLTARQQWCYIWACTMAQTLGEFKAVNAPPELIARMQANIDKMLSYAEVK